MKKAIFYLLACVLLPVAASADEGMWLVSTFRDVIYPQMKKEGLKLKPGEIYNEESPALCNAIVAVDGGMGTGSVISDKGLVITNHHVPTAEHPLVEHPREELPRRGLLGARTKGRTAAQGQDRDLPAAGPRRDGRGPGHPRLARKGQQPGHLRDAQGLWHPRTEVRRGHPLRSGMRLDVEGQEIPAFLLRDL